MLLAVAIGETEGRSGHALTTLGEVLIHQQVVLGPAHDDARRTAAMLESIQLAGERADRVLKLMAQLSVIGRFDDHSPWLVVRRLAPKLHRSSDEVDEADHLDDHDGAEDAAGLALVHRTSPPD